MALAIGLVVAAIVAVLGVAMIVFMWRRTYVARGDRTFITETDSGYKRALQGSTTLWDVNEVVVKGAVAPRITFVARDPATGGWREVELLEASTGAVNLRVQTCAPRPFFATTKDSHHFTVEAKINFQLDRERLRFTYHVQDFASALETRVQGAFRTEIGRLRDEELRLQLGEVKARVTRALQEMENTAEKAIHGGVGMPLGVKIFDATFNFTEIDPDDATAAATAPPPPLTNAANDHADKASANSGRELTITSAAPRPAASTGEGGLGARGVLSLRQQHLDVLADVFQDRRPAEIEALLAMLEMQTRQNIAEALGNAGALVVVTADEIGLNGGMVQREKLAELLRNADPKAEARPHSTEEPQATDASAPDPSDFRWPGPGSSGAG